MEESKRQLLKAISAGSLYIPLSQLYVPESLATPLPELGLFKKIYTHQDLSTAFNSYLLSHHSTYIDPQLPHQAMELVPLYNNDQTIYESLQAAFLASEESGLSVIHQAHYEQEYTALIAEKTRALISKSTDKISFNNHLNLSTKSPYIDQLRQQIPISGQSILLTDHLVIDPITDMFASEQSSYTSQCLALKKYCPTAVNSIRTQSLDLITQYNGLNNCPETQQRPFMKALLSRLKIGGHLIIQQADIGSQLDFEIATLSRYFTNLQAGLSWQQNLMHTPTLQTMKSWHRRLFQHGLTLKNSQRVLENDLLAHTLMHFHKTA